MAGRVLVLVLGLFAGIEAQIKQALQPPFRIDMYTALVPVDIRCVNDPSRGLSCTAAYPQNCKEKWDFPNPCTRQPAAGSGVMKYVHPFDSGKFLVCGLHGRLFVEQCPYKQVFHEGCGECVNDYTILTSNCRNMSVSPDYIDNPCTKDNILADKLFFPFPKNVSRYIHCDIWGKAWERECTRGEVWSEFDVACVDPNLLNPCGNPIADITFMYSHPCDPLKYIRCDVERNAYEISCPTGEAYHELNQKCEAVQTFYKPIENICHGLTFAFRHSSTLPHNISLILAEYRARHMSGTANQFGTLDIHTGGSSSGQSSMVVDVIADTSGSSGTGSHGFGTVAAASDVFLGGSPGPAVGLGTTSEFSGSVHGIGQQSSVFETSPQSRISTTFEAPPPSAVSAHFDVHTRTLDSGPITAQDQGGFDANLHANMAGSGVQDFSQSGNSFGVGSQASVASHVLDKASAVLSGTPSRSVDGSSFVATKHTNVVASSGAQDFGPSHVLDIASAVLSGPSSGSVDGSAFVATKHVNSITSGTQDFGPREQSFGVGENAVLGHVFNKASEVLSGTSSGVTEAERHGAMGFDMMSQGHGNTAMSSSMPSGTDARSASLIIQRSPAQSSEFMTGTTDGSSFSQTATSQHDFSQPITAPDVQHMSGRTFSQAVTQNDLSHQRIAPDVKHTGGGTFSQAVTQNDLSHQRIAPDVKHTGGNTFSFSQQSIAPSNVQHTVGNTFSHTATRQNDLSQQAINPGVQHRLDQVMMGGSIDGGVQRHGELSSTSSFSGEISGSTSGTFGGSQAVSNPHFVNPSSQQGLAADHNMVSSVQESGSFGGQFDQGSFGQAAGVSHGGVDQRSSSSSTFSHGGTAGQLAGANRNDVISVSTGNKIKRLLQSRFRQQGSASNTKEIHPALLQEYTYNKIGNNSPPCTIDNIRNGRTHFRVRHDANKFIQCDIDGRMHLQSCNINHTFDVISSTCVDGPLHLDNLVKGGQGMGMH